LHSIYGTKTFKSAALGIDDRDRVREMIGADAESLVFVFGMSDRKQLLLENRSAPYYWIDHRSGEHTEIPGDSLNELVEIEVANFVEQIPFLTETSESVFQDLRYRFESTTSRMSVGAQRAFRRAFAERAEGPTASSNSIHRSRT